MRDPVNRLDTDRPHGHEPPGFNITTTEDAERFVVTLSGELDLGGIAQLRPVVEAAESSSAPAIVVDLGDLAFIDSSGLRELLRLHRHTQIAGRTLRLRPGPPLVQRIMEISGLGEVLPFDAD